MRCLMVPSPPRREYLRYIPKYQRYERRHKTISAHCSPALRVKVGDEVTIGQCRPLAKTVRFNVLKVVRRPGMSGAALKKVL